MKFAYIAAAFAAGILTIAGSAAGQESTTTASEATPSDVLVVYDSSNSMWGAFADGTRKYEAGRKALASVAKNGLAGRQIGFRAYGHRRAGDCRDSELVAPFSSADDAGTAIIEAANSIRPTGKTPITYSLTEGLKDLGGGPGEILLISDGIETCDADPCELMQEWKDANVNVRVHVVGVGLNDLERTAMSCIAETSGGEYFDADSADGFETALGEASEVIQASQGQPTDTPVRYAIVYNAFDAAGRRYSDAEGRLLKDSVVVDERTVASGRGRNHVEGPGKYVLEVGALLRDGTVYEPVSVPVTVEDTGDTIIDVEVPAPARVNATFSLGDEAQTGALVRAYQDGEEVFAFRPNEEALARPGTYEFRTRINSDNQLSVTAMLTAGETTTVNFELIETVKAYVQFELPDGSIISRGAELWRDGEKKYSVHGRNGAVVQPGSYELRSDDQNLPLPPAPITIEAVDEQTYTAPISAGWVTIEYGGELFDYAREKLPTRAQLHSVDRGNWHYASPGAAIAVTPGVYAVEAFDNDGFFERTEVTVVAGETKTVTILPKPLGELVVTYAPSSNYLKEPDRASAAPLEGQRVIGGILRPGDVRKFLPGRYRISGWQFAGDVAPQEIEIVAGQRTEVVLALSGE